MVVAILAIGFAAVTFYISNRALVRERQNVFELGLLARLVEICGHNPQGSPQIIQGLLRMLPPDDLPGLRELIGQGRVPGTSIGLEPFLQEFFEAVDRRLEDGQPRRSRRWAWRRSSQ